MKASKEMALRKLEEFRHGGVHENEVTKILCAIKLIKKQIDVERGEFNIQIKSEEDSFQRDLISVVKGKNLLLAGLQKAMRDFNSNVAAVSLKILETLKARKKLVTTEKRKKPKWMSSPSPRTTQEQISDLRQISQLSDVIMNQDSQIERVLRESTRHEARNRPRGGDGKDGFEGQAEGYGQNVPGK